MDRADEAILQNHPTWASNQAPPLHGPGTAVQHLDGTCFSSNIAVHSTPQRLFPTHLPLPPT